MSLQLLKHLNGPKTGGLKKFIDRLEGNREPRICWYPSAGEDFRALLYLHPNYAKLNPSSQPEPAPPDIFLFTDYFPWQSSTFLDNRTIYSDNKTKVLVNNIEELPCLNLPLHEDIVDFKEGSSATGKTVFLEIRIESNQLGNIEFPVIYVFAENEAFYCEKLVPFNSKITQIIHVRYGGGVGGGGHSTGIWIQNVLKQLNCEGFITDGRYHLQSGDQAAFEICKSIPKENTSTLTPIRVINSQDWSSYGDVTWNLVS